jgi:hypothetical protein
MPDDILKAYGRRTKLDESMDVVNTAEQELGFNAFSWPSRNYKFDSLEINGKKFKIVKQKGGAVTIRKANYFEYLWDAMKLATQTIYWRLFEWLDDIMEKLKP